MSAFHHNPFISLTPLHDLTLYVQSKERQAKARNANAASPSHAERSEMSTTSTIVSRSPRTQPSTSTPTTGTSPSLPSPSEVVESLQRDGFVYIPNLLTQAEISKLLQASIDVTNLAVSGSWPHIRTVPKQFPPWPPTPPPSGIWGVQHLLHPDIPHRSTFAACYFHESLLAHVKALLSLPVDDMCAAQSLVLELFNLLVSPTGQEDFELRWHRDDVRPDISQEDEQSQLEAKSPGGRQAHTQYNIALTSDSSLVVVPGSHGRVRTDVERAADPYAAELPGQIVVRMQPGDAVFYDSNILHRGVYKAKRPGGVGRYTLHGCVGLTGHGEERARQVLQHAVGEYIEREDASFKGIGLNETVEELAEGMRSRLIAMGRGKTDVGYSLEG